MKKKDKDWKPATEFTVKKLRRTGPKEGQSLSYYMYGRSKGDAEWRTMADSYLVTGKKQKTRIIRKPRWTIKD